MELKVVDKYIERTFFLIDFQMSSPILIGNYLYAAVVAKIFEKDFICTDTFDTEVKIFNVCVEISKVSFNFWFCSLPFLSLFDYNCYFFDIYLTGCRVDWIVDLGSGRGYLSSSLVLQYGLNVVAIDSSKSNTTSALVRNKKLQVGTI